MPLTAFSPPGNVTDLSDRGRRRWSSDLDTLFEAQTLGDSGIPNDSPRPQFFNPLRQDVEADAAQRVMRWGAFPRKLARLPSPERWEVAEDRDNQEEYCEWSAERDRAGRILRAFFTTEVPGYYHLLAADDPDRLVDVYREHVGDRVRKADLLTASGYRERNRWNRLGAMHMVQPNNTLAAAVLLVAQSTIVRSRGGDLVTNANDLIACGVSADKDRNSDPLIVGDVNSLARARASITLADPVGLYLDSLQTEGWETPDGSDALEFWRVTRGDADHALRAVYAVPADRGFVVSDVTINGQPIASPSQIAEFIQVRVVGVAHRFGRGEEAPRGCRDEARGGGVPEALGAPAEELPAIEDLISAARHSR